MKKEGVQTDSDACRALIRQHSSSFYRSFRHLPPDRARAVFAVYAFCRVLDDTVDEAKSPREAAEAVDAMEKALLDAAAGKRGESPWERELAWAFASFKLETGPFLDQIRGQRSDLAFARPQDFAALDEYCYLVAGSVGLMLLPLLVESVPGAAVRDTAEKLGKAMQLSNIIRDIAEDARRGRCYIPEDLAREAGWTCPAPGADGGFPPEAGSDPALARVCEELAARAEAWYELFYAKIDQFAPFARRPLWLAATYYRAILDKARKKGWDVFAGRVYLSDAAKALLYVKSAFGIRKRHGERI